MSSRLRPDIAGALYDAAGQWIDRALRKNDSIFTPGQPVWTSETLDDLYERFVEHGIAEKLSFMEKLRVQLEKAAPEVVQLAAEAYYVYLLMPVDTGAQAKRKAVETILSWMPSPVTIPADLDAAFSNGLASIGVAKTRVDQDLRFLVEFARTFKSLPAGKANGLLNDPWAFKDFLYGLTTHGGVFQREALLHLLHPDTFEPIVARSRKQRIVSTLRSPNGEPMPVTADLDQELVTIRGQLTAKFGADFTFWDPPVAKLWGNGQKGPEPGLPPTPHQSQGLFDQILSALLDRGLFYSEETIANYLLALQVKRFVICTGISGTGKTRMAMAVAEILEGQPSKTNKPATDTGLSLKVHPYMLKYHRLVIPEALASLLRAGRDLGASPGGTVEVEVVYPMGTTRLSLYRNLGKNVLQLGFRGDFRSWFEENLHEGDRFLLDARLGEEDGTADQLLINTPKSPPAQPSDDFERIRVVVVRPDWTDSRGLLGYFNPLNERYAMTPFLHLLLDADEEWTKAERAGTQARPFFVILEEMNLARVEHYFSDFLSALESEQPLDLHQNNVVEAGETEDEIAVPRRLHVRPNVFFTGTVNIDETTYMFSPKVLDRAFVLELNEVDLENYGKSGAQVGSSELRLDALEGTLRFDHNPDSGDWQALKNLENSELANLVVDLHRLLARHQRHFGYRVANEVARFVTLAAAQAGTTPKVPWTALDLAVLNKVLPKLNGTQQELEPSLQDLFSFFVTGKSQAPGAAGTDSDPDEWGIQDNRLYRLVETDPAAAPRLPRCAAKVWRMQRRLEQQGFTSFIE